MINKPNKPWSAKWNLICFVLRSLLIQQIMIGWRAEPSNTNRNKYQKTETES